MSALLAGGVIAFAYFIGRLALGSGLSYGLRRSVLARGVIALVLGVALLTPVLTVLASIGKFDLAWLGSVSWIGSGLAIVRLTLGVSVRSELRRVDTAEIIVLLAAAVFVFVAASGRDETLGAGRDQQVYAEAAVALAERGTASVTYAPLDDADRTLLRGITGVDIPDVRDQHAGVDVPITLTHPLSWPAWLAIAHAMFGIEGVYAANSFVFAIGGLLFFLLLRCLLPSAIAASATLLLFALPSSLWISGISLSEPLAMTLLLAVPLLGASGIGRSNWRIAGVLLAATLIRLDAALAFPAVVGATLISGRITAAQIGSAAPLKFALTQILAFGGAVLIYGGFFRIYLYDNIAHVAMVVLTLLALTAAALLQSRNPRLSLRRLVDSDGIRWVGMGTLVLLAVYAAAIRPTSQPFSVFPPTSILAGTRDFRENSVLNLAVYVSWPILAGALGGACYALWRRWLTRGGLLRSLIVVLGIGPAFVYLWFPNISPDHPWGFRRFLPAVVPYTLFFAAVFVQFLTRRAGPTGTVVGAISIAAPYALIASSYPMDRTLTRENDGTTAQIATIAKQLPNELVVALGVDRGVAASMLFAYGKSLVIVGGDSPRPNDLAEVGKWIQAKSKLEHPAWLLVDPRWEADGANEQRLGAWRLTRDHLVWSTHPPATEIAQWTSQLLLLRVNGFGAAFPSGMFGGQHRWGATEGGFFSDEVAPFGAFRYTDGHAWTDLPSSALRDAYAIKLDVFPFAREGERRWLHVLVDGAQIWSGSLAQGVSTLQIPLRKPIIGDVARIELLSEAVDASEISPGDPRTSLGVGVVGIRVLRAGDLTIAGPGIQGFRSNLSIVDSQTWPLEVSSKKVTDFVLDVRNTGEKYWPGVNELGSAVGAIQIALQWYRADGPHTLVGDNRWPLFISLVPGDHTRLKVPLAPIGLDKKPLLPGEYEVSVGMVREGVALFAGNGDSVLSLPVRITP